MSHKLSWNRRDRYRYGGHVSGLLMRCNRRKSSATQRWNDVPRGTMDEVRSFVPLDLPSH
jgi:hypothetical protein